QGHTLASLVGARHAAERVRRAVARPHDLPAGDLVQRPPPPLTSDRVPEKRYLMTPGPTPVPPEVLAALAEPVVHHRGRDFRETYERCLARLREVYRTEHDVLLFTSSGTGAFESAVANLTSPGDRAVVVSAGSFGERWAALTKAYDADLVHVRLDWGESPE